MYIRQGTCSVLTYTYMLCLAFWIIYRTRLLFPLDITEVYTFIRNYIFTDLSVKLMKFCFYSLKHVGIFSTTWRLYNFVFFRINQSEFTFFKHAFEYDDNIICVVLSRYELPIFSLSYVSFHLDKNQHFRHSVK